MNRIALVTGVSCSGKDFLLKLVRSTMSLTTVNYGERLLIELSKTHPWLISKDELRGLPIRDINQAVMNVNYWLLRIQPVVVNAHIVFKVGKDLTVLPDSNEILCPQMYIHVSAPVEEILARRRCDRRERIELVETKEEVSFHQRLSENVTERLAKKQGSVFVRVWNQFGYTDDCLEILKNALVRFN